VRGSEEGQRPYIASKGVKEMLAMRIFAQSRLSEVADEMSQKVAKSRGTHKEGGRKMSKTV
jgi:hypothetical protein